MCHTMRPNSLTRAITTALVTLTVICAVSSGLSHLSHSLSASVSGRLCPFRSASGHVLTLPVLSISGKLWVENFIRVNHELESWLKYRWRVTGFPELSPLSWALFLLCSTATVTATACALLPECCQLEVVSAPQWVFVLKLCATLSTGYLIGDYRTAAIRAESSHSDWR